MPFLAFTPRDVLPDATALSAYSIWTSFPDGEKVVSARAIKHVDELAKIARGEIKDENNETLGAAVLFVVGRQDAEFFRPNVDGCASFARHLASGKDAGVRVLAHRVVWGEGDDIGKAFWGGELPVEM